MNLKRHLKKILIGSVISVLSFMIILSAIVVAITSTMQSAGGAWYKLKQTNENTETEETESGDIQAGVIKGKRTSYPSGDNLFYFGANLNPWVSMGARPGYHNCTWYAFGRFGEILGKRPALPTGICGIVIVQHTKKVRPLKLELLYVGIILIMTAVMLPL